MATKPDDDFDFEIEDENTPVPTAAPKESK